MQCKAIVQWLHAQVIQQFARQGITFVRHIDDGTKAARIMQAQQAATSLQIKVIMLARWPQRFLAIRHKPQAARHPQMNQQQALAQIQQQVFAAPAHPQHLAAHQRLWQQAQRPAQRLSQRSTNNVCARNAVRKRAACNLDFW